MKPKGRSKESLRHRADSRVSEEAEETADEELSAEAAQALVHELRVHQVELEIQNEELLEAQRELARARDRFIDLYDFAPVGYLTASDKGIIQELNLTFARMLGPPRSQVVGTALRRVVASADEQTYLDHLRTLTQQGAPATCELRLVRDDHSEFDAVLESTPVVDDAGAVASFRTVVSDISSRKEAERAWRQSDAIIHGANEGVVVVDRQRRITRINPAFTSLTHLAWPEVGGQDLARVFSSDDHGKRLDSLWRTLLRDGNWEGEVWCRRRDDEPFPARMSCVSVTDERGNVTAYAGLFTDVTEQKRAEGQLRLRAYHDPLTGLPNRALLTERLRTATREAQRHGHLTSLLLVDVDRFKEINDKFGHAAGDTLLKAVAERLSETVRTHDTVARLGGDEFAVILTDVTHAQDVVTVADKLMTALAPPLRFEDHEIPCTVSVGIAVYPNDAEDEETLHRRADLAMYRAKDLGRNTYRFFDKGMTHQARQHARIKRELRRGLQREEFEMHYQPVIDGASGELAGAEALLRWNHPQRGLLRPEPFLEVAEDTGQIKALGKWVIRTVCQDWSAWCGERPDAGAPFVGINVSPRQLRSPEAFKETFEELQACGPAAPHIAIEITEGVAMSTGNAAREQLQMLKGLGVALVMDDFGTGYSSLSYLKQLPFDTLKIDRAFIHDVTTSDDSARLVETIVHMAHGLRLKVVAEGVETAEQLAFVRQCGSDYIQGDFISPPVPGTRMSGYLEKGLPAPDSA